MILLLGPVDYPDTDDIGTILLALDNDRVAYLTARWFIFFGLVLAMASSLGFYYVLREAGGLLSLAIIGFITGTVFVMIQSFIELAIAFELGSRPTLTQRTRRDHPSRSWATLCT